MVDSEVPCSALLARLIRNAVNPIAISTLVNTSAVVGSGLRFVDDFGIKVEPELRYTRWFGRTFNSESTRSSENQIEVNLAFTF